MKKINSCLFVLFALLFLCIGHAVADDEDGMDCVGIENTNLRVQWRLSYYNPKLLEQGELEKNRDHIIKIRVRASLKGDEAVTNAVDDGLSLPMTLSQKDKILAPTLVTFREGDTGRYRMVFMKNSSMGISGTKGWKVVDNGNTTWTFIGALDSSEYKSYLLSCIPPRTKSAAISSNRLQISRKQLLLTAIYSKIENGMFSLTSGRTIKWVDFKGDKIYEVEKVKLSNNIPEIIIKSDSLKWGKACGIPTPFTSYKDILEKMNNAYSARAFPPEAPTITAETLEAPKCIGDEKE